MIPDFKTFIGESIWSDMQDRGTGDMVKKEDDVNLMSVETFVKYLIKRYDFKDNYQIEYDKKLYMFSMPVLCANGVFGPDNMGVDYIKDSSEIKHMWILDSALPESVRSALKKRFELSVGSSYTFLSPLDGRKPTNQFVVDVLDYMADLNMDDINIIRAVKESIWSDMQERGTGDTIKKEDELDFIGGFKLYERLRKMYKYTNVKGHIIAYYNNQGRITVPLFVDEGMNLFNIDYFVNSGKLSIYARWYDDARNIFMKLSKKYHIYHPNVSINNIEPFDGDVTNTFFIEVVDFILSCVEPPYKKVIERNDPVSESVWSDMQERGTGDVIKKEDDVNLLDYDGLYDYIKSKYSGKLFYIDKEHFGQKDETICVDPIKNVSLYLKRLKDGSLEHILLSWTTVDIYHPFLLKLEERFFVSSPNVMRRIIKEKDGTCTNKTYIDVIDFFLEHIDNIVVNESIWSDMQERGTGDMIKIEDDVNLLDRDGLYDYLKNHYTLNPKYIIVISGNSIEVPLFHKSVHVEYIRRRFTKDEILIPYACPYLVNGLFPLLAHRYKLKQDITGRYYIISPADSSSVTNKFFLEVLDFITEFVPRESRCVEKMVKESIWSDMQDRGTGDMVKKEDDIDILDQDSFYKYITEHYRSLYNSFSIDNLHKPQFGNEIHVPFINVDNNYTYNLVMKYIDNGPFIAINKDIVNEFPDIYRLLSYNYKIDRYIRFLCLNPFDGSEKITNTFYLDVLDFLIDNIPDKLKAVVRK